MEKFKCSDVRKDIFSLERKIIKKDKKGTFDNDDGDRYLKQINNISNNCDFDSEKLNVKNYINDLKLDIKEGRKPKLDNIKKYDFLKENLRISSSFTRIVDNLKSISEDIVYRTGGRFSSLKLDHYTLNVANRLSIIYSKHDAPLLRAEYFEEGKIYEKLSDKEIRKSILRLPEITYKKELELYLLEFEKRINLDTDLLAKNIILDINDGGKLRHIIYDIDSIIVVLKLLEKEGEGHFVDKFLDSIEKLKKSMGNYTNNLTYNKEFSSGSINTLEYVDNNNYLELYNYFDKITK